MPARLTGVAIVALLAWWIAAPRDPMPPVWPMGDQPVYGVGDDPRLVVVEPVLHAPWVSDPSRLASMLGSAIVWGGGAAVALALGASVLPTLVVLLAFALDASFGATLGQGGALPQAVGLVWLAVAIAAWPVQRTARGSGAASPLVALLSWGLAVWWTWMALAAWPLVVAGQRRGTGARWPQWIAASLAVGAVAGVAHFASMAAIAAERSFAPGLALTWREALAVAFEARTTMPAGSFVAGELTKGPGVLALGLAAVGLAFGTADRVMQVGVALAGTMALVIGLAWPVWREEVARFALWTFVPFAAIGLTWVTGHVARARWMPVATAILGTLLVADAVATDARPRAGREPRQLRDALASALAGRAAETPLVIVAEDTRIDSALVAWASRFPGATRAPQDGAIVSAAIGEGRTVLAGPTARRHLELAGIDFTEAITLEEPMSFALAAAASTLGCATVHGDEWSTLPGVEYTGRFGASVPPGLGGALELIVGDDLLPHVRAATPDGHPIELATAALLSGPGAKPPPADYWFDGGAEQRARHVQQIRVPAHVTRSSLVSLRLGRRAPRVLARLTGFDRSARARVCAASISRVLWPDADADQVPLEDDGLFGTGWHAREGRDAEAFRWADTDAVTLIRSATRAGVTVMLDAEPAAADGTDQNARAADGADDTDGKARAADGADDTDGNARAADGADSTDGKARAADGADSTDGKARAADDADSADRVSRSAATTVTLKVNGIDVGMRAMRRGVARYVWAVPANVWVPGTNELWWHTSRAVRPADAGGTDTRRLAMRVTRIEVSR